MIFVFEGHDCAGKSTLVKEFCQHNGLIEYKKDSNQHPFSFRNEPDKWKYFSFGMTNEHMNVFKAFDNFVIDRAFVSELVYSKYYERETYLKEDMVINLYKNLRKSVVTVLVECDYSDYVLRHISQGENYFLEKHDFDIQKKMFQVACKKFKGSKLITLNTSKIPVADSIQKLYSNI